MHGLGAQLFHQRDHRLVAGNDLRLDRLRGVGNQRRFLRIAQPLHLVEPGGQGCHQDVSRGAALDEGLHAGNRLVDDKVRRDHTGRPVIFHAAAHFAQHPSEFAHAADIAFRALLADNAVRVGQELGHVDGDTRDLVDAVAAMFELGLAQHVVKEPDDDFVAQQFLAFEPLGPVLVETRARLAQVGELLLLAFTGVVAQLARVEIQRRVVDQAELRHQLRRLHRKGDRRLVDVVVDADRLPPEPGEEAKAREEDQAEQAGENLQEQAHPEFPHINTQPIA